MLSNGVLCFCTQPPALLLPKGTAELSHLGSLITLASEAGGASAGGGQVVSEVRTWEGHIRRLSAWGGRALEPEAAGPAEVVTAQGGKPCPWPWSVRRKHPWPILRG